jgi:hypothetical protein
MDANNFFVLSGRLVFLFDRPWYANSEILLKLDCLYNYIDLLAVQAVQMVFLLATSGSELFVFMFLQWFMS